MAINDSLCRHIRCRTFHKKSYDQGRKNTVTALLSRGLYQERKSWQRQGIWLCFSTCQAPPKQIKATETYESYESSEVLFAKNPSPYSNLLDQNSIIVEGAKILRVTKPSFGLGYGFVDMKGKEKDSSKTTKIDTEITGLGGYAIYPTPVGLRIGAGFFQGNAKLKSKDDSGLKAKMASQKISLTLAAALNNGLGAALNMSTNKEDLSFEFLSETTTRDVDYGVIVPQIYYAGSDFEAIFTWTPSLRHETGTKDGTYVLELEYGTTDIHPYTYIRCHRNAENSGEEERDHFSISGGLRVILDRESNLLVLLNGEEAYYTRRTEAAANNIASYGASVAGEHVINSLHVLGYKLAYKLSSGKGKTSTSQNRTISAEETDLTLSYKLVMR